MRHGTVVPFSKLDALAVLVVPFLPTPQDVVAQPDG
jgi:hypothetical protein